MPRYPEGYTPPSPDEYRVVAGFVADEVRHVIQQTFGWQGVKALHEHFPAVFAELQQAVLEAYEAGHYRAWGDALMASGARAQQQTADMLLALLRAPAGESDGVSAVRVLGAYAGVVPESVDTLVEKLT